MDSVTAKKRTKVGRVLSAKMNQTASVVVLEWKRHRIIGKRYQKGQKYLVHNPDNTYQAEEMVEIAESRPISRHKHWTIVGRVTATTKKETQ